MASLHPDAGHVVCPHGATGGQIPAQQAMPTRLMCPLYPLAQGCSISQAASSPQQKDPRCSVPHGLYADSPKASVVLSSSRAQGLPKHLWLVSWTTCAALGRWWGLSSWLNHPGKWHGSSSGWGLTLHLVLLPVSTELSRHHQSESGTEYMREGGREKEEGDASQKRVAPYPPNSPQHSWGPGLWTGWLTVRLQVMENRILPTCAQESINF